MNLHWPTEAALEVLHGAGRCETCGGRQWVAVPDPLYPGALIDARCPECCAKGATSSHPGARPGRPR